MVNIKIGTCGYSFYQPPKDWKETYKNKLQAFSKDFKTLELNRTFYKLPMVKTVTRWQKEVVNDFEFTIKAWQAITHPTTSPTWKNKDRLSSSQRKQFGYFNPSEEVFNAWDEIRKRAKALQANIVVFQTPNSFDRSKEHKENLYEFFSHINRKDINLAWEPRGNWNDHPSDLEQIYDDLNLIHVVDLMRREPVSTHSTCYIRLHGLNKNEYDYNYDYSKQELNKLAEKLEDLSEIYDQIYCMFNNYEMYSNATQLRKIIS
jgi:uncharacterized protein YecE (DUF72 family)